MRKNEINELIKIYEEQGFVDLIAKLYQIKKQYDDIELESLLLTYLHETNENNHSYFFTSDNEQIVTNNNTSIIYFNKKLFSFKNINDRKIVTKESFEVNKLEMLEILNSLKDMCRNNFSQKNNIAVSNSGLIVFNNENHAEFSKQEFDIISKLLNNVSFKLSKDTPYLYVEGDNGYAYIKGKKTD